MVKKWDVVILGGGFAGLSCARRLDTVWKHAAAERVLLVSAENYFVFQPLLPEVVGASLEPHHVIAPIRLMLRRAAVERAQVVAIDLERRRVEFDCTGGACVEPVEAEHLVLALGSGIDMHAVPGMMEHALFMKNLADAIALRGHIIRRLEEAILDGDEARRRALLHFVVVGGGYSGVETAAEVLDLLHAARKFYPTLRPEETRVTLVHAQNRLLPELDERLGQFAHESLARRGMGIVVGHRAVAASSDALRLDDGSRLATRNIICTIGNAPHPVLRTLAVPQERGRVKCDEYLRVPGHDGVWAIGDGASAPDGHGGVCPPTAQFASRLGPHVAHNIIASLQGRPLRRFEYQTSGQVATLGHRNGVAYIGGVRLSGFPAWWLARTIHWARLPGIERKIRVVIEWTLDLFFPRDLNYIDLEKTQAIGRIHIEAGDVLFHQGDRSDTFYVIVDGVVELSRRDALGKPLFCEQLGPGMHFGEGSLIRDRVRTTTAVAKSSATLLVVGPKDFGSLLASCALLKQALHQTSFRFRPDEELARAAWPGEVLDVPIDRVMTAPVETLSESAAIADAFEQMAEHHRSNFPLTDAAGRLVGMVTRTDLYRAVADGQDLAGPIRAIATTQVTTLAPNQTVRDALATLRRKGLKHAPVVDAENRPVGMLSYLDLVRASVRLRQQSAITAPAPAAAGTP